MNIVKDSIMVGYVSGNSLDRAFMPSVFGFMNYDADERHGGRRLMMGLASEPGAFVDDNRNALIRKILPAPAEYFLLLDTDTIIAPTAPYLLLDTAKEQRVKIITGLQFSFDAGACVPLWWDRLADNNEFRRIGAIKFGEIYQLAACGMGCCLIHRDVFEKMAEKWGDDSWTWFGRDQYQTATGTAHYGEDMTFCKRATEAGFEILGHAGVEARHAKRWEIGFEEFQILYQGNYRGVRG